MSQDRACGCIHSQQWQHIRIFVSKDQAYCEYSQDSLGHISKKYDQSGLFTKHTQGIGRSCIAASALTDINPMHLSINISRLKDSKHISNGKTNQAFHYSFSFLSLTMNFSEVPLNPKDSRILFSRYLT